MNPKVGHAVQYVSSDTEVFAALVIRVVNAGAGIVDLHIFPPHRLPTEKRTNVAFGSAVGRWREIV